VRLSDELPPTGTVVFHAKHRGEVLRRRRRLTSTWLVAVRADSSDPLTADFEILQNGRFANGRRRFHVPHWPQPGLQARDPHRGDLLRTLVYKGVNHNLHPALRSDEWIRFLAGRGIEWRHDSVEYSRDAASPYEVDWSDYREADALLAVRPDVRSLHPGKPATKLYNAWHAGVPALLGPEAAYRELRESPLDYLEVASLGEARAAVAGLQDEPGLYRSMVEYGARRATEFSFDRILERWTGLLFGELPRRMREPGARRWRRVQLPARRWVGRIRRLLSSERER
jgi:hypothetical protein